MPPRIGKPGGIGRPEAGPGEHPTVLIPFSCRSCSAPVSVIGEGQGGGPAMKRIVVGCTRCGVLQTVTITVRIMTDREVEEIRRWWQKRRPAP